MRIKKSIFFVVTLLLLSACQNASLRKASYGINAYPALWEAKSSQGAVYLLGSVHALSPRIKWYGEKISQAFDASDELVLETVYNENDSEVFKKIDRRYGLLNNGKVISDYLTKLEYIKYKRIVEELDLKKEKLDRVKPWLFFIIVGSIVNQKTIKYGVDRLFYDEAKTRGIKISAVETTYQQMRTIAFEPLSLQIQNLKEFLNTKKVNPKSVARQKGLMVAWASGDVDKSAKLLAAGIPRYEYNNLIIKRNNLWYPKIKKYLSKKQTTMIVVGLAHLVGRGNIIRKLKNSGYKVRRLQ